MKSTSSKIYFQIFAGALAWFTLCLQFPLTFHLALSEGFTPFEAISHFFTYFTILSNLAIALLFTLPLLFPQTAGGKLFSQTSTAGAVLVYIFIVAVIYHLLLRKLWDPQGWFLVADIFLHSVNPILYAVFWVFFVPKGTLAYFGAIRWIGFPLAYMLMCLIQGAANSYYPYPFLDVTKLGYPQVLLTALAFIVLFWVVGIAVVGLDKKLK